MLRAVRSWPVESRRWVRKAMNLRGYERENRYVLRRERNWQYVECKRCWRGWFRNLLRERDNIGGKRVPKTLRSVSERAIGEFELECEWQKKETDVIGWSSFASGFDIDKLAKVTGLRFMKEIVGDWDYFELNTLFDLEPMKWFKCWSNTRVLGSVCDCASDCILNLLKAFFWVAGSAW